MARVIVDTSAWIESFRPGGDSSLANLVKELIINGDVLLPGIIRVELLRGAKNKKEYDRLDDHLKGLAYLPVGDAFWERLAKFSFRLFRKGIVVPLTDSYIALLCIEDESSILHRDRHFDLIAEVSPLKVAASGDVQGTVTF